MTKPQEHAWTEHQIGVLKRGWQTEEGRQALTLVVEVLGIINGQAVSFGSSDETYFNEGRRWVGRQIMHAVTLSKDQLMNEDADGSSTDGTNRSNPRPADTRERIRQRNRTRKSRADATAS